MIADASERDERLVHDLGADEVVRRGDDVATRIRELVPEGVDALADGAVQFERVAPAIRDGGAMAVVRTNWDGEPGRGITLHRIMVFGHARDAASLDELRRLTESGKITPRVARVFRPEQAAEAHRVLQAGGVRGRLVLDFATEPLE